jgi:hypothetical protein
VAEQTKRVAELAALVEAEDEYHAHMVRDEIVVAMSLARLVHKPS